MVRIEDDSTLADSWKELYERSRLLPPPSQSVRLAVESHLSQDQGFQLSLSRVQTPHLPQVTPLLTAGQASALLT